MIARNDCNNILKCILSFTEGRGRKKFAPSACRGPRFLDFALGPPKLLSGSAFKPRYLHLNEVESHERPFLLVS